MSSRRRNDLAGRRPAGGCLRFFRCILQRFRRCLITGFHQPVVRLFLLSEDPAHQGSPFRFPDRIGVIFPVEDSALVLCPIRGYCLPRRQLILPGSHAGGRIARPGFRHGHRHTAALRIRTRLHRPVLLLLEHLLLFNDPPLLLLLHRRLLHRLLLLPGKLLLFRFHAFILLMIPHLRSPACNQVPDPGRRQIHHHQKAERGSQENQRRSQPVAGSAQHFPQRPSQNDPQSTAAGTRFSAVGIRPADHSAPAGAALPVQILHGVTADQHDKCTDSDHAQNGVDPRLDRRSALGGPDHQPAAPQRYSRQDISHAPAQPLRQGSQPGEERSVILPHPQVHRNKDQDTQSSQCQPSHIPEGHGIR